MNFNPLFDKDVIKDFKLIRPGIKPTIVTIDGFLSDDDKLDNEWQDAINCYYPNNEWYHLKWKSKSEKELISNFTAHIGIRKLFTTIALPISLSAIPTGLATISIGAVIYPISFFYNPWYKALRNSKLAGNDLADILIKNKDQKFILMGHSLGGNVIYNCLKTLSNKNLTIINEVHILGGAVSNSNENWSSVKKTVKHNIFNYFSKNDKILQFAYSISTNDRFPVGRNKIDIKEVINLDVSNKVKGHMSFKKEYKNLIEKSINDNNSN